MHPKKSTLVSFVLCTLMLTLCCNLSAQDKKLGRHTVAEWRALIDSTWGSGPATATKLQIFDTFWSLINQQYGGFPCLEVDWDSLRSRYRPEVEAGVSRGRFSAIMNALYFSLQDIHSFVVDVGLVSPNSSPFNGLPKYDYGPGVPLFWPSGWGACGVFGAALTPLPDSSLLVYKAIESHPLGLVPGDIITGYDGLPWKRLYKEALAVEFPLGWGHRWGSTTRSMTHSLLTSAGINWSLFDTVDVVKYSTGDTLHLATAALEGLAWEGLFSSEQLPVPGVRIPNFSANEWLTYGVVEGTSIGYVYCGQWSQAQSAPFRAALVDLLTVKNVTGLILDCRLNVGGDTEFSPDAGLDLLFNEKPAAASSWQNAWRNSSGDHFGFSFSPPFDQNVTMQPDYFDRPIAVLTGPATWSMGDMHSFRLRSHPMVRFFGLPTNGAFCVPNTIPLHGPLWGSWYYVFSPAQMYSLVNNEGFLLHKGFPVDEEVWLTREGVVKGEDDVVKRALEWITSFSHAHSLQVSKKALDSEGDSCIVTATVKNPQHNTLAVSAILQKSNGLQVDSVLLVNDGLHGDGAAGDSLWGAPLATPPGEQFFSIALRTDNQTEGTSRRFPRVAHLTSAGPIAVNGYVVINADTAAEPGKVVTYRITLKNEGSITTVPNVTARVRSLDTSVTVGNVELAYDSLTPGQSSTGTKTQQIKYSSSRQGNYIVEFKVTVSSNGIPYWTGNFVDMIVGVEAPEQLLPTAYAMEQNYPNPFNPKTGVRFQVPALSGVEGSGVSEVKITVYDLLGREMAVLVNEKKPAGTYEVNFDATGLASGIYIYRLTAGSFVQSRKMILLK